MNKAFNKMMMTIVVAGSLAACGKQEATKFSASAENYISPEYLESMNQTGTVSEYASEDIKDDYYDSVGGGNGGGSSGGSSNGGSSSGGSSNGGSSSGGSTSGGMDPDVPGDQVVEEFPEDVYVDPTLPVDPAQLVRYYWACTYTMTGEKGAVWYVERLNKIQDDCKASHATVKANNPKASISFTGQIFMGYHEDNTTVPFHWRCDYTLKGEKGATWKVRRHLKFDDNCVTATKTVKANNPKATIMSTAEVFLGYHTDMTANLYYWKCVYKLQGEKGAQWNVERFTKFDDDCKTATATVKKNNPKARILSTREVFIGYHKEQ